VGFLEEIAGKTVGLDTTPLIYFIEKHSSYHPLLRLFFTALANGEFKAVTSTVTLVETLTHPMRLKQLDLARRYQDILLNAENMTTLSLSPGIAVRAARIRADYNFRTPDAVQLATAIEGEAEFFLTNDRALRKFSELRVFTLANFV
jgi:predicted nucleic acid-binding protein